ncbi:MAG: DUF507 family protein [Deltaproteobacteria bacterium]|jgi:hypothetical protein
METRDTGRVQDKLINRLDRQEKQRAFQQSRFFRFKIPEIHSRLSQILLEEKIVETDDAAGVSEGILRGLKSALNSSEFDFKYFISPIRSLVPRPNPYSLYMTQYLMEVLIDDPSVIDIYGTDEEIYHVINRVISKSSIQFEKAEAEVLDQLAKNRSLIPGTGEYETARDQLLRKKVGDPYR